MLINISINLTLGQALGAFAAVFAIAAVGVMGGAAGPGAPPQTIDVQRINIREPDGTLRMVISSAARAPGIIVKGHEQPHPTRQSAGMIFYNDEGTENGGLIFDGRRDAAGTAHSSGSLTFDRYEQDQVVQMFGSEDGRERSAGVAVNDQPEQPMDFAAIDRARHLSGAALVAAFRAAHAGGTKRAFMGRSEDGAAEMVLRDATGVSRLRLRVAANGDAAIEFLGKNGAVVRSIEAAHTPSGGQP